MWVDGICFYHHREVALQEVCIARAAETKEHLENGTWDTGDGSEVANEGSSAPLLSETASYLP